MYHKTRDTACDVKEKNSQFTPGKGGIIRVTFSYRNVVINKPQCCYCPWKLCKYLDILKVKPFNLRVFREKHIWRHSVGGSKYILSLCFILKSVTEAV